LPDALVFFLQHNTTVPELCILTLEVLNYCVMYIKLVEKFSTLGLLKDIVRFCHKLISHYRFTLSSIEKTISGAILYESALKFCEIVSKVLEEMLSRTSQQKT
jgi:hypothetical protein